MAIKLKNLRKFSNTWFKPLGTNNYWVENRQYRYTGDALLLGKNMTIGGVEFSPDGQYLFTTDKNLYTHTISRFTLGTPWDISTAEQNPSEVLFINYSINPAGIHFKPDGTKMYLTQTDTNNILQYSLENPFQLVNATFEGAHSHSV